MKIGHIFDEPQITKYICLPAYNVPEYIWLLLSCTIFTKSISDREWRFAAIFALWSTLFFSSFVSVVVRNYFASYKPFPCRRNVACLSLLYRYLHRKCTDEIHFLMAQRQTITAKTRYTILGRGEASPIHSYSIDKECSTSSQDTLIYVTGTRDDATGPIKVDRYLSYISWEVCRRLCRLNVNWCPPVKFNISRERTHLRGLIE